MMSKTKALRIARARCGPVFRCVPGPTGYGFSTKVDCRTYTAAVPLGTYAEASLRRQAWIYEEAAELIFGRDELGMPPLTDSAGDYRGRHPKELFRALFD